MMEDWTDIIGEELESIEEPLPADDWSVLQRKYAASRKKKRAALFAWAGGITSVAAAIALVLLLIRPSDVPSNDDIVAEQHPPIEEVVPTDTVSIDTPSDTSDTVIPKKKIQIPASVNVVKPSDDILIAQDNAEEQVPEEEEIFEVVKDTVSITERLLADAGNTNDKKEVTKDNQTDYWGLDDFPDDEPKRKRIKVSVGLSGSASASPIIKMYDVNLEPPQGDMTGPGQKDSTEVETPEPARALMRSKSSYTEKYRHEIPKSFGVSARLHLTDRLSINTGLNYTRYASDRTRIFSDYTYQNDRQYVHYLGIPVRLDWMIVNRKHFNFYLGAGIQADKCIYATIGGERLHEKEVLFGLNGAMGLQFNIVPMVGLYFEPDISYSLNEGSIQTYRSREPFVVTIRGGLRFNF
ncbi:MAG: outer membrane beta-barrel protein [Bacteroidales bacterium]|nr:outer membrane beta-barrel protein [Bacteroidales bacterium]